MNSGSYSPCSAYAAAASTKLLDTFVTEMPTCFTSFGSRPSACEMRFCTSTAAPSRLRVRSNVIVIADEPSLPLVDDYDHIRSHAQPRCRGGRRAEPHLAGGGPAAERGEAGRHLGDEGVEQLRA